MTSPPTGPGNSELIPFARRHLADYLGLTLEDIRPTTDLRSLDLDSLDAVALLVALEDRFGVVISDHDLADVRTLEDLAVVARRDSRKSPS